MERREILERKKYHILQVTSWGAVSGEIVDETYTPYNNHLKSTLLHAIGQTLTVWCHLTNAASKSDNNKLTVNALKWDTELGEERLEQTEKTYELNPTAYMLWRQCMQNDQTRKDYEW